MHRVSLPLGTSSSLSANFVLINYLWAPSSKRMFASKHVLPKLRDATAVFKSTCPCDWAREEFNWRDVLGSFAL